MTDMERNAIDLRNLLLAKQHEITELEAQIKKADAEPVAELFKAAILDSDEACDVLCSMTDKEVNAVAAAVIKQFCEVVRTEVNKVRAKDAERKAARKNQRLERERRRAENGTNDSQIAAHSDGVNGATLNH